MLTRCSQSSDVIGGRWFVAVRTTEEVTIMLYDRQHDAERVYAGVRTLPSSNVKGLSFGRVPSGYTRETFWAEAVRSYRAFNRPVRMGN